jgi:hypothetical protein
MRERQCHICKRLYTRKSNHVKQHHSKYAYTEFEKVHVSPELCHVCKCAFDGSSLNHIKLKHRERALRDLAKTLE